MSVKERFCGRTVRVKECLPKKRSNGNQSVVSGARHDTKQQCRKTTEQGVTKNLWERFRQDRATENHNRAQTQEPMKRLRFDRWVRWSGQFELVFWRALEAMSGWQLSEAYVLGYKSREKTTAQRTTFVTKTTGKEWFSICYGEKLSRIFLCWVVGVDFGRRRKLDNKVSRLGTRKKKHIHNHKRREQNGT